MTTQPAYLRYLESAKQAETADRLRQEGYTVEEEKEVGDVIFDLVATKDGRTDVFEFKSASRSRFSREQLRKLQETAHSAGYQFRIVVAVPPPRVHVEVDTLKPHLLHYVMDHIPSELDSLSTQTRVCGLSDLEIGDLRMKSEEVRVSGTGSIDVELHNESRWNEGAGLYDSYPFHFKATLQPTGAN